ncbi:MAG: hypothetical protein BGN82_09385 [Alphaproteobacteria bacterium 65-7]|nr:MAG: hypothetical protein BGN82_09385 [Alphaproteobacteria bacterium 65-7]
MKGTIIGAAVLVLSALPGSAARAADAPLPWAKPMAGAWTLSGVSDGDPYCRLSLGADGAIGGASIDVSATCRRNFPLEEVAAWTLRDGGVVLIDPLRHTVLKLARRPDGGYGGVLTDGRQGSLDRGAPPRPKSRQALLDGTFALSGPNNRSPCGFAVSARSAAAGRLEQAGACPMKWKTKAWAQWRFTAGRLNLQAANGATLLSLAPADDFTFVAEQPDGVAEQPDGPLFFGPGVIEGSP